MILYCRQWNKTVQFYRDLLKLPVSFSNTWFVEFHLTETSRLSIADEKKASIKSCPGKGITLSLQVRDIQETRQRLKQNKITAGEIKTHPWNALVFYLFDPEGHRIEVWQPKVDNKVDTIVSE